MRLKLPRLVRVRLQNWLQSFTFSVGGTLAQALNRTATDDMRSNVALARCGDVGVGDEIDRMRVIAVLSG